MDNIAKARGDDNPDSLDNKDNPRRGNKRGRRFYNKKTIIRMGKYELSN